MDVREQRLFATCIGVSIVLHGAALAVAPRLRHAPDLEMPRVLSVVLLEATSAPEERVRLERPPVVAPLPPRKPAPRSPPRRETLPSATPAPAPATPAIAPQPPAQEAPPSAAVAPVPAAPTPAAGDQRAEEPASPPDFRAAYLRNPPPAYPASARRKGEEGTVTLRVLVSTAGRPERIELERSSGSNALDLAALESVRQWRFAPARRAGAPYEAWVLVPIVFRLEPRT